MAWSTAIAAIAVFLETFLKKTVPSAAEKAKKIRLEAEEKFKEFLKKSDENEKNRTDGESSPLD